MVYADRGKKTSALVQLEVSPRSQASVPSAGIPGPNRSGSSGGGKNRQLLVADSDMDVRHVK